MSSVSIFDVPDLLVEVAIRLNTQTDLYALASCNWLCYGALLESRARVISIFLTEILSLDLFLRGRGVASYCRGLRVSWDD